MFARIVATLVLVAIWYCLNLAADPLSTIAVGGMTGQQFQNSDVSYLAAMTGPKIFALALGFAMLTFPFIILLIWWGKLKSLLKVGVSLAVLAASGPQPASAYYDKTDYAEPFFILPNESAFFIPDVGANKDSQTGFGSQEYLQANKIAAKRFMITHAKLTGSAYWGDYYVPTGRLIIVDRTTFNREWVGASHRGTSAKDESFPCQSSEGLDISVGIAIGASVFEADAARFLYRFGVKPPAGDRTKPEVIFTSVFYGRGLAEVMDGPVRSKVQSLVCNEFTKRTFNDGNKNANLIMKEIEKSASDYMASVGITLDYIGWADTFTFDKAVQDAVNRRYVASQDMEIASTMAPHTATLQALASAEATRTMAEKWNGAAPSSVSLWWLPASISDLFTRLTAK